MEKTVLVIEDDGPIAEMLELLLGGAGYSVQVARTGPEGLERARSSPPDLITLDLALPAVDGASLLRALANGAGSAPIVVVSAHPEQLGPEDRRRAAAVIGKPFDIDDLLAHVAQLLP